MAEMHPNAALVQRAYQAFAAGDVETLKSVFAADVVWHSPGKHPLAGDHVGLESVLQFLGGLVQRSEGTFAPEVQDMLANDHFVVVIQQNLGTRNGRMLDTSECVLFTIRGGKIADARGHFYDLYAVDAWWS
jgi:ketosteroid isomerase-like protein